MTHRGPCQPPPSCDSVPEGPSPSAPRSPASELAPPASLDAASAARLLASDADFQPAQSDCCTPTAILVRPKPFLYPQSNSCIESQNHSGWKSPPTSSSPTVNPSNPCVYFFLVGGRVNIVGLAINVIRSSSSLLQTRGQQRITELQNVRGWQGPLWVPQPNPLPKQGHPEQAAQHRVQAGLESPEKETPQPPWAAWARAIRK